MDGDRWRRLNEIFDAVIERPPEERAALLETVCPDDPTLRDEVASLIAYHDRAGGFLDRGVAEAAPELLADDEAVEGRRVGQFVLRRELGRGGMGIVYLADDTRLGRHVALKSLPSPFGGSETSRRRLIREAKALAALRHSNVAQIFSLEEIDGELYLVSEYVEGRTLREDLAAGPLDRKSTLMVARQIATALAAAHAAGIVHRDLKPENIVRTAGGKVKVLDFGLAAFDRAVRDRAGVSTTLTAPGSVLGTPGYMAPEQLLGKPADARADVFAFGVILYEMASGRHPFDADSTAAALARMIEGSPEPLPPSVAGDLQGLDEVIRTCLERNPDDRYRSGSELVRGLELVRSQGAVIDGSLAAPARRDTIGKSVAWWRVHQIILCVVYAGLMFEGWMVLQRVGVWGRGFFLAVLAGSVAGMSLRLHLLFTERQYPALLGTQRQQAIRWITRLDLALAALAVAAGVAVALWDPVTAAVLIVVGVAVGAAVIVIEPSTTRAAFGEVRKRKSVPPLRRS